MKEGLENSVGSSLTDFKGTQSQLTGVGRVQLLLCSRRSLPISNLYRYLPGRLLLADVHIHPNQSADNMNDVSCCSLKCY
ncbi:Hypothetical predicted protein, partial [Marmota monax]